MRRLLCRAICSFVLPVGFCFVRLVMCCQVGFSDHRRSEVLSIFITKMAVVPTLFVSVTRINIYEKYVKENLFLCRVTF